MVRRALTYQLILAVAVGPLLCCCSAGKAPAAPPATTGAPVSSPVRVPAVRTAHACCSHTQAPAKSDPERKQSPSKPGSPVGKCPCKDGAGKPQIAQAELAQTDLATFLRALAFDAHVPFVSQAASESGPQVNGTYAGRYLDCVPSPTDELLFAHHNLRC